MRVRVVHTRDFSGPAGQAGRRDDELRSLAVGGSRLRHVLNMDAVGAAPPTRPSPMSPIHDPLIEESLDRVAFAFVDAPPDAPWSRRGGALWALLRALLRAVRRWRARGAGSIEPRRQRSRSRGSAE